LGGLSALVQARREYSRAQWLRSRRDRARAGGLLAATVQTALASRLFMRARSCWRRAGGHGDWTIPEPLRHLPSSLRAHCGAAIDFDHCVAAVAVIGAGASAFDNAATALEAGAAEVHLFCRRAEIQVIQPYRWLTFRGFLRHFCDLDDAWRWRFMRAVLEMREGFPQATYDRCARHANFHLHEGRRSSKRARWAGRRIASAAGNIRSRFRDLRHRHRHEFRRPARAEKLRRNIATWADRYRPADGRVEPAPRPLSLSRG